MTGEHTTAETGASQTSTRRNVVSDIFRTYGVYSAALGGLTAGGVAYEGSGGKVWFSVYVGLGTAATILTGVEAVVYGVRAATEVADPVSDRALLDPTQPLPPQG